MTARPLRVLVAVAAAALLAACFARVDYEGTAYQCPDGVSCPPGFTCVDQVCLDPFGGDDPDGAIDDDAGGAADADRGDAPAADAGPPIGPTVDVPGGTFVMGCDALLTAGCALDAFPGRNVLLAAFAIDVHEVTQGEYQACVAASACELPDERFDPVARAQFPVTDVSHADATAYCAFAGKRLPTEAEWEKAARGAEALVYPWGDTPEPTCALANFNACTDVVVAVSSHVGDASPYGATEMAGNVAEWVADFYSSDYYDVQPTENPPGPASGSNRVTRGGSYNSSGGGLATFVRDYEDADATTGDVGFRCAR